MINNNKNELIVCFTEQSYKLDFSISERKTVSDTENKFNDNLYKQYMDNRYKALFHFGFLDKPEDLSDSLAFLHGVVSEFVKSLSKNADIEFSHEAAAITPSDEEVLGILHSVPYVVGLEYINAGW